MEVPVILCAGKPRVQVRLVRLTGGAQQAPVKGVTVLWMFLERCWTFAASVTCLSSVDSELGP